MSVYSSCYLKKRPEAKARQMRSKQDSGVFLPFFWQHYTAGNSGGLSWGYEWGGTGSYKAHVWKVNQFIEEEVWIKCLFIEVIRVSPHRQPDPLVLSRGTPRHRGREAALPPQLTVSSPLSWGDSGVTSLDCRLLNCSVKLHEFLSFEQKVFQLDLPHDREYIRLNRSYKKYLYQNQQNFQTFGVVA